MRLAIKEVKKRKRVLESCIGDEKRTIRVPFMDESGMVLRWFRWVVRVLRVLGKAKEREGKRRGWCKKTDEVKWALPG